MKYGYMYLSRYKHGLLLKNLGIPNNERSYSALLHLLTLTYIKRYFGPITTYICTYMHVRMYVCVWLSLSISGFVLGIHSLCTRILKIM